MTNVKTIIRSMLIRTGIEVRRSRDPFNTEIYKKYCTIDELESRPFYNVGAGSFFHPYWTNIDYVSDWYKTVQKNVIHHDLMSLENLPIDDERAKIIYTSHTIEHIKDNAVKKLFEEAFRSLKKGGIFRITTGPDAETDFRALMNNDSDWFYWDKMYEKKGTFEHIYSRPPTSVSLAERWLHHVASQLSSINLSPSQHKLNEKDIYKAIEKYGFPEVLNYFCDLCNFQPEKPGNHINWFTHEKIIEMLKAAGFNHIYRSGFGQSSSPFLRNSPLFDSTHPQMSIYVEAVK